MDTDRRISKLDEAAEHLNRAAELISEAVEGTELMPVARIICDSVDRLVHSEDASILTLRKDLVTDSGDDPIWTRPLVSVKNMNRRDI